MSRCVAALLITSLWTTGCGGRAPLYRDAEAPIDGRVTDLLNRMTLADKFGQLFAVAADVNPVRDSVSHGLFGVQWRDSAGDSLHPTAAEYANHVNRLQRYFVEQTRLGIPIIFFEEALHGLMLPQATVFPQAIGLAATFDTLMMTRVSQTIAAEARQRGLRQVLSPVINLATDVRWGRTEESYGEDPLLTSAMAVAYIRPLERAGVLTTPKHFVANVGDGGRDSYPINIGRRLMRETLFPPFEAAVREAGARSVMAAYNSVDGEPASASRWLLTDILKGEWNFRGFVISDAGGVGGATVLHNTAVTYADAGVRALQAGLDVIFQTSVAHRALFWPAFVDGRIPTRVIDAAVRRVLRAKFELGLFEHPYVPVDRGALTNPGAQQIARDAATASLTLLRNRANTLPFGPAAHRITVIGADAIEGRLGGYSAPGHAQVTILDGIRAMLPAAGAVRYEAGVPRAEQEFTVVPDSALGSGLSAEYFDNITLADEPHVRRTDHDVNFSWPFGGPDSTLSYGWYSVRWQGTVTAPGGTPVSLAVAGNDGFRLFLDDTLVIDRWRKESYHTDIASASLMAGRSYRIRLEYFENSGAGQIKLLWHAPTERGWRSAIERAVASAQVSDAAVIVAGIEEGEFRDRASLRLPGHQEELIAAVAATGRPVVVVIVGGSAVTMSRWIDQVGAVLLAWYPGAEGGHAVADALFGKTNPAGRLPITFPQTEGQLPLSYWHLPTGRGDDYADVSGRPLFPFGHGLSYTRFEYSALRLPRDPLRGGDTLTVRFTITNRGARDGDEVPQLYLRAGVARAARPVLALAAFSRVHLKAGESRVIALRVPPNRFAAPDDTRSRVTEPGRFVILIGASSADLRLRGSISVR